VGDHTGKSGSGGSDGEMFTMTITPAYTRGKMQLARQLCLLRMKNVRVTRPMFARAIDLPRWMVPALLHKVQGGYCVRAGADD
jgi:hypothetical protein